jgi:hypothetical protein
MRNNLNKLDKYLGKRVKITKRNGKVLFLNVRGTGKDTTDGEYISGFNDERMNTRIYLDVVALIQAAEEPFFKITELLKKVKK